MSLASISAGADSIMIEVHPDPENAAVDPLQPINFLDFRKLMKQMDKQRKLFQEKFCNEGSIYNW